ncbi:hypothetical protein OROMI_020907 [Orobanche minor]
MEPSLIGSVKTISGVFIFRIFSLSHMFSLCLSHPARSFRSATSNSAESTITYSCLSHLHIFLFLPNRTLSVSVGEVSDRRHLSPLLSFITATIRPLFLVGKSDLVGSVMMAPTKIYVIHGGEWSDDNKYEGERRELIPIPPGGISLKDLVAKIEMRLMKPRDGYVYEIDALINDDESIEGDSTDELSLG